MEEPYVHKIFIEKVEQKNEKIDLRKEGFSENDAEKAIFAYPIKHYMFWQEEVDAESIDMGTLGENFSILEMDEFTVCIGDTFKIGDAIIQVSQPFQPYWELDKMRFAKQMVQSGRTGWYFRVLQEGYVQPESDMELIDQPYPQWSIAACNEIMFLDKEDLRLADDLASCDLLAKEWRITMKKRLRGIF
ncbi:MOSC domain-containing protein [Virgibacillus sp. NKC19-16]|uniref:MOSC domain-containing protein n=1 Tax=Virgibacillus salidurans TaxID=2831673 RepID=UPI001F24DC26|nr:MOSC domain-containing protein [Virgibacillus sp. NKC19-16]UJL47230.1 MOSC domain-containing protein [Virgibacillus sp. NKC19-16]